MSPTISNQEPVVATADVNVSAAEPSFSSLSEAQNRHLSFPVSLETPNSLADRLAYEMKLVQFVLTESEAAFTSPVRKFVVPGGQQLQYNQN
ncbi:hypothetical protein [Spirosoma jeollabukense]